VVTRDEDCCSPSLEEVDEGAGEEETVEEAEIKLGVKGRGWLCVVSCEERFN
jgi:hypothetical protein